MGLVPSTRLTGHVLPVAFSQHPERLVDRRLGYPTRRLLTVVTWSGEASYFVSGSYLEESGDAENMLHVATTLSLKF